MNSTFGAPSFARLGIGQAGVDTSAVRPITPGKAAPGLYSLSGIAGGELRYWATYPRLEALASP